MAPDAHPTDDELDQRLRTAAAALVGLAPAARVDGLAARVEAELAELDARAGATPLENAMTSDTDPKPGSTTVTPPTAGATRTDDSGLHDIRSLAQDTKKRISRRITSQHDVDERMLASTSGSLRAIALPEPAMVIALPEAPATMEDVRAKLEADPVLARAAAEMPRAPRKRTGLWVGTGAVAVAAAAAVVIMAGGGSSKKSDDAQVAAAAPSGGAPGAEAARVATVDPAPAAAAPAAGSAVAMPPPPPADVTAPAAPTPAGDRAEERHAGAPEHDGNAVGGAGGAGSARGAGSGSAKSGTGADAKPPGGDSKSGTGKPGAGDTKPGGGDKAAGGGAPAGGAGGSAAKGGGSGEKSIEDLLNDASGGGGKPKDEGPKEPTGPVKDKLEPAEMKKGMSAVAGAAQACYDKFGVAGHVKIKATIAPSGEVSKVEATGEFAGTPTGGCVASAVKGASFPSWTGAPMSVTYSFTLQE